MQLSEAPQMESTKAMHAFMPAETSFYSVYIVKLSAYGIF